MNHVQTNIFVDSKLLAFVLNKFFSEIKNEPIVIAHHPLCGKYDDHFFCIKGRKVCRGCLTVYPSATLGLIIILMFAITDFYLLFYTSLALFSLNLLRLVLNRTTMSNMIFNVILGGCLSTIISSALYCPEDKILLFYPFVVTVFLIFMSYRGLRMLHNCKICPNYSMFPSCVTHEKR